ncbi:MAG: class I SAM-dependent methyltransferase [Ktedonobacterales bacterium]
MVDSSDDQNVTRASYNRIASAYAAQFADEFDHKPLERRLLAEFAAAISSGLIADIGCGPGQAAAYLSGCGAEVVGVDLADEMVAQARRLFPTLRFERADMRALPFADGALAGIVALYCLIHLAPDAIPAALAEFRRTLRPGGALLVSFHIGEETRHVEEMLGAAVNLDFRFFTPVSMRQWLTDAGFDVSQVIEREPYPDVEVQTRRAYILANAPTQYPSVR